MKKVILLLALVIALFHSCKKEELNNTIIFSGKIKNSSSDTLKIINNYQDVLKSIVLDKSNTFKDTLDLPEGYYFLNNGEGYTSIYLKPTFNVNVSINAKDFDNSIKYEGKGANENNYLAEKFLLQKSFGKLNYYSFYAKLPEKEFIKLTDSLYDVQKGLLDKSINLDTTFSYVESKSFEFDKLYKYAGYENMNRFVTGNKDFKVSESYPDPYENIDLSNEKLLLSSPYLLHIQSYFLKRTNEIINKGDGDLDKTLEYVNLVDTEIESNLIKQELLFFVGKNQLGDTKSVDKVYNKIKPALYNEKYLSEVTEKYKALKRTEKGAISPVFEFNDFNGNSISLTDLKGKLVYIDIWATWCLPCLTEIPSLKKMEEHFEGKEIQFVSISQDKTEEDWRKMVEKKKLGGIQLIAPDITASFFKDYSVTGIPRFILIDQDGKIIDANAKRPSNPDLLKEIEQYLLDLNNPNT